MRRFNKLSKFIILFSLIMVLFSASSVFAKLTDPPPPPNMSDSQFNPDLGDDWDDDGISQDRAIYSFVSAFLRLLLIGVL